MVFFNCNACGEALKKNQVEKHTYKCRQCQAVSCVDCGRDFWGSEYEAHTKCMTENEKYCGKGYVAKVNKGEVKQEQWIEKVQDAIEKSSSNPKLKGLLEKLQDYPNIPRKKAKFENFLKNSLRVLSPALISQVWEQLMTSTNNNQQSNQNETKPTASTETNGDVQATSNSAVVNGSHEEQDDAHQETVKLNKRERKEERQKKKKKEKKNQESSDNTENLKKKKKRKHEEDVLDDNISSSLGKKRKRNTEDGEDDDIDISSGQDKLIKKKKKKKHDSAEDRGDLEDSQLEQPADESSSSGKKQKFKWTETITAVLEKKGEMSLKKLRRKVLQEFAAQDAANYNEDNLSAKFNKKVTKLPQLTVLKERVRLK